MNNNYTTGSVSRHVTGVGGSIMLSLLSVYGIGLVDVYFLSYLNNEVILAAVGTAGVIFLPMFAMSTAFAHTVSILVAREMGNSDREKASIAISNLFIFALFITTITSLLVYVFIVPIVSSFDISGEAADMTIYYVSLLLPTNILVTLTLMSNFISRAIGDSKNPLFYTLGSSGVSMVLSPICIVFLGYGLLGSVMAITIGRVLGCLLIVRKLMLNPFNLRFDAGLINFEYMKMSLNYFIPILLSNLIMPVSALFVMYMMSGYGDSVVAGYTVAIRMSSVVFCIVLVVPGAISPIASQNYGAKKFDRVLESVWVSLKLSVLYVMVACIFLYMFRDEIVGIFRLSGPSADILYFYLKYITLSFVFSCIFALATGFLNSVEYQSLSMKLVLLKTLVLTVPGVYVANKIGDQNTVLVAEFLSIAVASSIALFYVFKSIKHMPENNNIVADALH